MTIEKLKKLIAYYIEARRETTDEAKIKEINEILSGFYNWLNDFYKEQNKKKK